MRSETYAQPFEESHSRESSESGQSRLKNRRELFIMAPFAAAALGALIRGRGEGKKQENLKKAKEAIVRNVAPQFKEWHNIPDELLKHALESLVEKGDGGSEDIACPDGRRFIITLQGAKVSIKPIIKPVKRTNRTTLV